MMFFRLSRSAFFCGMVLLAIMAFYAIMIGSYYQSSFAGTDENGYLLTAKRLATTGDTSKSLSDPHEFVSGNWVETQKGVYYAKYPIGYPALCAMAYFLGGPHALFLVNPILATLAVAGIFLLGRAMLGDLGGAFAAILLATNPMHAHFSLSALSHSASICFTVWGMFFIWQWSRHGGWWNAGMGGVLAAYAATVRYTEALLVLPTIAMIAWRWSDVGKEAISTENKKAGRWPWAGQIALMLVVSGCVLTPLLIHQWIAYGSPWISGYSLCGESTGFSWKWFDKNWPLMFSRMDSPGLFLIFPIGLAGWVYLALHDRKKASFLGLWALPNLLLYTAYYWAPEGDGPWYVRFFLCVFPALILSALFILFAMMSPHFLSTSQSPKERTGANLAQNIALGSLVLLIAGLNLGETNRRLGQEGETLRYSKGILDVVSTRLPLDTIFLSDEGVLNFVEYARDYRLYAVDSYSRQAIQNRIKILNDGDPHPFQRRKAEDLKRLLSDKKDFQLTEMLRDRLARLFSMGHPIAVICRQDQLPKWRGRLSDKFEFAFLSEGLEVHALPNGDLRPSVWEISSIKPCQAGGDLATGANALREKMERLQVSLDQMRADYQERYPGAIENWKRIADLEHELGDLRNKNKSLLAKAPLPQLPSKFIPLFPAEVSTNPPIASSPPAMANPPAVEAVAEEKKEATLLTWGSLTHNAISLTNTPPVPESITNALFRLAP